MKTLYFRTNTPVTHKQNAGDSGDILNYLKLEMPDDYNPADEMIKQGIVFECYNLALSTGEYTVSGVVEVLPLTEQEFVDQSNAMSNVAGTHVLQ